MKLNNKHFILFKAECKKWIKRFELSGFEFRLRWEDIEAKAESRLDQAYDGVYTITLSKRIEGEFDNNYLKRMAKHEVLHCLIGEFSECGYHRFVSKDEFGKLEEKLVNKLEKLIL